MRLSRVLESAKCEAEHWCLVAERQRQKTVGARGPAVEVERAATEAMEARAVRREPAGGGAEQDPCALEVFTCSV